MKILDKIFVISIILIPMLLYICVKFYEVDRFNIIYMLVFIITLLFIIYDLSYVFLTVILKVGKDVNRISLFYKKDD